MRTRPPLLPVALVAVAGCSTARQGPPPPGGQTYAVDCGDEAVRVFDPPGTVRCMARPARGAPVALAVTVSDKAGTYAYEPEQDS